MAHDAVVSPVQYDLTGGINLEYRSFGYEGQVTTTEHFLAADDFLSVGSNDDVLGQTHRDLYEHTFLEGRKGHQIHVAIVNDGVESSDITIVSNNWGGSFQNDLAELEIANRVRANPNRRFAVFDHLGQGQSDQLDRGAAREMSASGRFNTYAEIVLNGIQKTIESYDRISLLGCSMGGLVVAEMAALFPRSVDSLVMQDAPGSRHYSDKEFFTRFAIAERKHAEAYLRESIDPSARIILNTEVSPLHHIWEMLKLARRHEFTTQWVSLPRAMAHGALGETIKAAAANVENNLTVLSPIFSEFNNPNDVFQCLQQAANQEHIPRTMRQITFNGTHAFAVGSPAVSAALEARALVV